MLGVRTRLREMLDMTEVLGLRRGFRVGFAHAYHRLSARWRPERHITLDRLRDVFHYRVAGTDWQVFKQIFIAQEYQLPSAAHDAALRRYYERIVADGRQPLIIDCGANIGCASVWFATQYPKARILAVEPDPDNFRMLVRNSKPYALITPINAAVSDRTRNLSLTQGVDSWAFETRESDQGGVQAVTIPDLIATVEQAEVLAIKIDIEGFEAELFRSNLAWVRNAPLIVFESHDFWHHWRGTGHAVLSVLTQERRDYLQRGENMFALSHALSQDNDQPADVSPLRGQQM